MNIKRGIQRFLLVVTILWFAIGSFIIGQSIYEENASKRFIEKYYYAPKEISSFSRIFESEKFLAETEDYQVEVRKDYFEEFIAPRVEELDEDSVYTVEQHFIKKYPIRSYEESDSSRRAINIFVFVVVPVVLWVFFYICVWIFSGFKKDDSVKNNKEE
jgi:hypothetical protein